MTTPERNTLRIGVLQDNLILEERLIQKKKPVTVGHSIKSTFCIPTSTVPELLTMFEVKGSQYLLRFDEKTDGRVAVGEAVHKISDLRTHKDVTKKGNVYYLPLSDKSRGKVVVSDITFLFQMVPKPPPKPKAKLPGSAKGWFKQTLRRDQILIAGFLASIIFQGGLVTTFKVAASDRPRLTDEEKETLLTVDVQFEEEVIKPPEEKSEKKEADAAGPAEEEPAGDPPPTVAVAEQPKAQQPAKKPSGPANHDKLRPVKTAKKPDTIVNFFKQPGMGGANPLSPSSAQAYREAFSGSEGVSEKTAGEDVGGMRDGPVADTGGTGTRVAGLTRAEKGGGMLKTGEVKTAAKEPEKKINLKVGISGGNKTGGTGTLDGTSVTSVFKRRSSAFRTCYETRLKMNPNLSGKVVIQFTIGPAGRITSINVSSNSTGDSAVGSCIVDKVRTWKFNEPENGAVMFTFPIVLSKG